MASKQPAGQLAEDATTLRELIRLNHLWVRYDKLREVVVITRFALHWSSLGELHEAFDRIEQALAGIPKHRTILLVDSREAPMRNDPVFEAAFSERRRRINLGFKKIVVLVRTAVGRLQIQRHAKVDDIPTGVSTEIHEALDYLDLPRDFEF